MIARMEVFETGWERNCAWKGETSHGSESLGHNYELRPDVFFFADVTLFFCVHYYHSNCNSVEAIQRRNLRF